MVHTTPVGLKIPGYEVQVYAMDSALMRARVLFEFFVGNEGERNYYHCRRQFGVTLRSSYYTNDWSMPLHSHLMHAQDRSQPMKLQTPDGPKDLNEMPVYFAKEILELWRQFEKELTAGGDPQLKALGELARSKRKEAIDSAKAVVNSAVARHHAELRREQLEPVFIFGLAPRVPRVYLDSAVRANLAIVANRKINNLRLINGSS